MFQSHTYPQSDFFIFPVLTEVCLLVIGAQISQQVCTYMCLYIANICCFLCMFVHIYVLYSEFLFLKMVKDF